MTPAIQPLAAHVFDTDRRRAERTEVALDTLMADREGQTFAVRILNLSERGFMAQSETALCQRAPVRLDVPTIGWMRAEIVWVLGERVGAAFRDTVDPHAFATFVKVFGEHPRG